MKLTGVDAQFSNADRHNFQHVWFYYWFVGGRFPEIEHHSDDGHHTADLSRRRVLFNQDVAAVLAEGYVV